MKRITLLAALLLLTACRRTPAAPLPTAAPTAAAPTAIALPTATAATQPPNPPPTTVPSQPTHTPDATLAPGPLPLAPIFDLDPHDRAPYVAGLVNPTADDVPGAPVYHLDIAISDDMTTVEGRQTVFYTNQEDVALSEIVFHLHPNLLDSTIAVSDLTVDGVLATISLTGAAQSILTVALPAPLPPGGATIIDLRFRTAVPTEIGRNYGVLAFTEGVLALAHFYPMVSVYDESGWNTDEADIQGDLTYSDVGYYMVRVSAPAGVVVVASGVVVEEQGGEEKTLSLTLSQRARGRETLSQGARGRETLSQGARGRETLSQRARGQEGGQTVTYAVGPARDFYLAAGDFAVVSQTVGATTINSYAPAELGDGAALALDVAAATLAINEARLSPFPYTELDIVTTPTTALGIEYPGLIVGTLRMYDIAATTQGGVPYSDILESTTAHEVVHQWFYNLVGNDQLDQPWLDESMTGYHTYRYYADRYGQAAGDAYFGTFAGRWEMVDREEIPIGLPVRAYQDAEYSAIVYGRGPFFLRELEETLGRETFDAFLRDYVAAYRWGISTTADFQALAETHCVCDLDELFAAWITE